MIDRKYRNLVALGLALTSFIATPALATASGFYFGLNAGQSKFDVAGSDIGGQLLGSNVEIDDSDVAWSVSIGYRISPYIGVDASYMDMGAVTASSSISTSTASYYGKEATTVEGVALSLVGAIPIGHFEISAKLGALMARTNISSSEHLASSLGYDIDRSHDESSSTTETLYGLGIGYAFRDYFHFKVDWVMVPDAGDEQETGESDVSTITVGFQFRF